MSTTKVHRAMIKGLLVAACINVLNATAVGTASAGEYIVHATEQPDYKAVFGQVESRDLVMARARIGGTITSLVVEEGVAVSEGDVLATIVDDKLALRLGASDARLAELQAQLANAEAELKRSESLVASGTVPKTRLDTQQTLVTVLASQITAAQSDRAVIQQETAEGKVLAPGPGRVLAVPVTKGSVIMAGETVARIAGGGYFLRLALPERHASNLRKDDVVRVGNRGLSPGDAKLATARQGKIIKVYPEITGGRVLADVEVEGLGDYFAGERTLVWIPVSTRTVMEVPSAGIASRNGVDYVTVQGPEGPVAVAVIIGETRDTAGGLRTEVLSGLNDGDKVITP